MEDYASRLFGRYAETHADALEGDLEERLKWFRRYARRNYLRHLGDLSRDAPILEVGCGKGLLLQTLRASGFTRLFGVDLSARDIEVAAARLPEGEFVCADAIEYLAACPCSFDAVILKAVLEHVPKTRVLPLLKGIAQSLRPGGLVVIDVPNMDWLFAAHERYMDFTHEVGFTCESLGQVMRQVFDPVAVVPADHIACYSTPRRIAAAAARWLLSLLLRLADCEGASAPLWCRSLVAVGRTRAEG